MFKETIQKFLPKNQFARGVSVLVGGTFGAQVLMMLISPLLTRIYSPSDFGLLAIYIGILNLFTVVASFRYQLAIPLPESDEEAAHITLLSLFILFFITFLSCGVAFFAGTELANLFGAPQIEKYIWLLPLGILFGGGYQIFNYWAIRAKSFGDIANTKIKQSLVSAFIQVTAFKMGGGALLFGHTLGQGIGTNALMRPFFKSKSYKGWTFNKLKKVALRYKAFPIFSTWASLFNTAGSQLPPILFAVLFSPAIAGLYALTNRVLASPALLIGNAIGNVFHANAAENYREGKLQKLFENVLDKLAMLAMPMMVCLVLAAPQLFSLIFGEKWADAGIYAQFMSVWLSMVFIASPLSILFTVLEEQKIGLFFQSLMLFVRLIVIYIGYLYNDIILAVMLFSLSSAFLWFGFLIWAAQKSGSSSLIVLRILFSRLMFALFSFLPLLVVTLFQITSQIWWLCLVLSLAFLAGYLFKELRKVY